MMGELVFPFTVRAPTVISASSRTLRISSCVPCAVHRRAEEYPKQVRGMREHAEDYCRPAARALRLDDRKSRDQLEERSSRCDTEGVAFTSPFRMLREQHFGHRRRPEASSASTARPGNHDVDKNRAWRRECILHRLRKVLALLDAEPETVCLPVQKIGTDTQVRMYRLPGRIYLPLTRPSPRK